MTGCMGAVEIRQTPPTVRQVYALAAALCERAGEEVPYRERRRAPSDDNPRLHSPVRLFDRVTVVSYNTVFVTFTSLPDAATREGNSRLSGGRTSSHEGFGGR